MFDISKISEQEPWALNASCNSNIDFCVWILLNSGLQIPPFNYHSSGNQPRHQVSLDAANWYTWLSLVVTTQDDRLGWHIPNIETEVSKQLSRTKQLMEQYWSHLPSSVEPATGADNSTLFDSQAAQLNQYFHWQENQYQQAAAGVGSLSQDTPPAMVWQGEQRIREQLESLWPVYLATPRDNNRLEELDRIALFYQDLKHQFSSRGLSTLKVYLVEYPTPIFFPVPPVSILVSQVKDLSYEDLRNGIFHATERLVTFST